MAIRAVAYCRYSSDNQRAESIDAQLRAIESYCRSKNYTLINKYVDEAMSGTSDHRPDFQKAIQDAKAGLYDVLVVHKLDRFARDRYDSAYYKRELKKARVRVESVLEPLNDSPESILLESLLEGMNEYYSVNLARETRKGLKENALVGRHTGGRPPYGYRVNPTTMMLEIDEKTAPAVRLYFDLMAQRVPIGQIAERLNEIGYRTYNGKPFTKNSFWDWSNNKKYIGVYVWDVAGPREEGRRNTAKKKPQEARVEVANVVPPLISQQLWDEVQEVKGSRKHRPGEAKARQVYLLSGLIECGKCGSLYRGESYTNHKTGNLLKYYKCGNRSSHSKCNNTSVRKDEIEKTVLEYLTNTVLTDAFIEQVVQRVVQLFNEEQQTGTENMAPIHKELTELERRINNWIDAVGDGTIDKASVADKLRSAVQRKEALILELERITLLNAQSTVDTNKIRGSLLKMKNTLFTTDESDKKRVLQDVVEKVVVQPSNNIDSFDIEITCRFLSGVESGT